MPSEPTPKHPHTPLTPRSKPKRQVNNIIEGPPFEMSELISVLRLLWRGWNFHTPTLPKLHFLSHLPSLLHGNRLNLVLNRRTMEQGTEWMLTFCDTSSVMEHMDIHGGKTGSESRIDPNESKPMMLYSFEWSFRRTCSARIQYSCYKAFVDFQNFYKIKKPTEHKNVHQLNHCSVRPGSAEHFLSGAVS